MGIFTKKASANDIKSEATTVVPSENASHTNLEKEPAPVLADKTSDSTSAASTNKEDAPVATTDTASLSSNKKEPENENEKSVPVASTDTASLSSKENQPENEKSVLEDVVEDTVRDEDQIVYPSGAKLAVITLALCMAVFLVALDNTIIATAIPTITNRFNSLSDIGWYGSSYLLTTCALQLFFGKSVYLFLV